MFLGIAPVRAAEAQGPPLPAARTIRLEGNKAFTTDQILHGLGLHIDYHLAAHRQAPESEFAPKIQTLIRDGYLRAGFPEVKVTASPGDALKGETLVNVREGERYQCGKIKFEGTVLSAETLRADLVKVLAEPPKAQSEGEPAAAPFWEEGQPAPFDEQARTTAMGMLQAKLGEHGYFAPKLELRLVPDPASHSADLLIRMLDEGIKGTIEEFRVSYPGSGKNSDDELLKFLHLEKGMSLRPTLTADITNQLWTCGRFIQHDALLEPLEKAGTFRLNLMMEDLEEAPPLSQNLSTNAEVVLKCRDWLSRLNQQPYDLVANINLIISKGQQYELDLGLGRAGLALAVNAGPTNGAAEFIYGVTTATQSMTHFSAWRNEKLTVPSLSNRLTAFVNVLPNTAADRSGRFNLTMGLGFKSRSEGEPLDLQFNLAPCTFLSLVGELSHLEVHDGILEGIAFSSREVSPIRLKIDAATGRLLEMQTSEMTNGVGFRLTLHTEQKGLSHVFERIQSTTSDFREQFNTNYPFSSWVGFMVSDLLESPLAESPLVEKMFDGKLTEQMRRIRVAPTSLKAALGKRDLAQCLYPLEVGISNLFASSQTNQEEAATFLIPPRTDSANPQAGLIAAVAPYAFIQIDKLWTPGSWPWTVSREAVFTIASSGKYTTAEMQTLLGSGVLGPLGSGVIAAILARLDANLAEKFARRGLDQLSADKLQMDLGFVLAPETGAGRLLGDTLRLLAGIRDQDLCYLAGSIGLISTNALMESKHLLKSDTNLPPAKALAPLIQEQWEPWLQAYLGGFLTNLLRNVGVPASAEDAFARAIFLKEHPQNADDTKAAIKFLNQAAEQGFPKAELLLGSLYESGEAGEKDTKKAMALYRKAADAHEPHAACRVADMYLYGKGVTQDPDEAAKWLRIDAKLGCGAACFKLANYAEQKKDTAEALDWFRRSGTNCTIQAQSALGERLSDGFTVPPNYAEAYMWFTLASRAGDRPAGAAARLLQRKLTPAQIADAEKEADAILERHSPGALRRRFEEQTRRIQAAAQSQFNR